MTVAHLAYWSRIARRPFPVDGELAAGARFLGEGKQLRIWSPDPLAVSLRGVELVPQRAEDPLEDELHATLILHQGDARRTAAFVEERLQFGDRILLVDQAAPGHIDPALMTALLDSTVYVANLAAFDTDLERALLTAMIPVRDGAAFREYLAHMLLDQWAWAAFVRPEVERRFGPVIPPELLPRAEVQARTRLGAYLVHLQRRGLRCHLSQVGFEGGRVDRFWFSLAPRPAPA